MPSKKSQKRGGSKSAATEEKVRKAAGDEIVDALVAAPPEELREKLVALAAHENETEEFLEKNERLKELKEEKKEIEGPSKDTLKSIKLQRKFISQLLEEQGT